MPNCEHIQRPLAATSEEYQGQQLALQQEGVSPEVITYNALMETGEDCQQQSLELLPG